jgi:hypothetical protein
MRVKEPSVNKKTLTARKGSRADMKTLEGNITWTDHRNLLIVFRETNEAFVCHRASLLPFVLTVQI